MLIGLGLYVFGLVLFISGGKDAANDEDVLTKNGRQVAQNTYDYKWKFHGDNSTENGMKTLKYSIKQEFYNRSKHKRKMPVKNYKIVNFKNRKIYNRKKSIGGHTKRSNTDRDKKDNSGKNERMQWQSLKNLTFEERVNVVFGKHRVKDNLVVNKLQQSTNLNITSLKIHANKQMIKVKNDKMNNNKLKSKMFLHNSTLTTYNTGFLEVFDSVYVFSSFYDDRQEITFVRNVIIARSAKNIQEKLWCLFWDPSLDSWQFSELAFYETCENHVKYFAAYIGSCEIPENVEHDHIYISNKQETNIEKLTAIKVTKNRRDTNPSDISVCVPPLFGSIDSLRLLEFIEFFILLGIKHFTFYTQNIPANILKILKHYENAGLVTLINWPLNMAETSIWYHGQSAAVWDCLYRNMYIFKHVAFIDIDEFIFPRHTETLTDFIQKQIERNYIIYPEGTEICAYRFESAYFDPITNEIPSNIFEMSENIKNHLVTLNSVHRREVISNIRTKMIVDPIKIFELGIHHVSKPMQEHFQVDYVTPDLGVIHHYSRCQSKYGVRCHGNVREKHALRYQNRLVTKIKWRLYHLMKDEMKLN
jgi:hypothetical protein